MKIKTNKHKKVATYDQKKEENGWLLELNSDRDNFTEFIRGQVYLTVVSPGKQKGFHLHKLKTNHLTCIKGEVTIGVYNGKDVDEVKMGEGNFKTIKVLPNFPLAIRNDGNKDAYLINYCHPAYDPEVKEQEEVDIEWRKNEK